MPEFKVATGRSNYILAEKVCESLGTHLSEVSIRNFSDGEIWVKFEENVRGVDLFLIQTTNPPAENLLELLIMIDAAKRASARRVTAVIPYFGYARQDRKDQPRVSITAKLIANLITRAGADRIITIDLHSAQIQGYFGIPFDHLYASPVLIKTLFGLNFQNPAFAAPDIGGIKTARSYANRMGGDLILVDKRRPKHNVAEVMNVVGDTKDRTIIVIDDMLDTGNTFVQCAEALKNRGAKEVFGVVVHPIFSGEAFNKVTNCEAINKMFVTDTIEMKIKHPKIQIVSIAELLGEAILRTHDNRSISSLFEIER